MRVSEEVAQFEEERNINIDGLRHDHLVKELSLSWNVATAAHKYTYNFSFLGRPIIQLPQDMVAIQELIWQIKPDLIIETGVAHGGSLIMSAAMLALIDYCDAASSKALIDPRAGRRRVLGLDIDVRPHNRDAIEAHPLSHMITLIEGSSVAPHIVREIHEIAKDYSRVMVMLDSNHTHDHVLEELKAFASLVSIDSYCVVFDTIIEDLPAQSFPNRPWDIGNNPKTAVHEYLRQDDRFEIDRDIEAKIQITVAPDGYLRRVR